MPRRALISAICLICLLLTGCGQREEIITRTDFILNTAVSLRLYRGGDSDVAEKALDLCRSYERIFSRTDPRSELYRLNHGEIHTISDPLAEVIGLGLACGRLSGGALDITAGALSDLWQFTAEEPSVPEPDAVRDALAHVNYQSVTLDGNTVTMPEGTVIDLGALAKGYIADRMAEFLREAGVTSATIDLGGNLYCLGHKPDGSDFRVGVQYPFQDANTLIATVDVHDLSVVTSGIYERYFEADGKRYHHILDTSTGYPTENNLLSVTILSPRSADADALSTTCFVLGLDEGMALIDAMPNVYAIFITDDYAVHCSQGLRDTFPVNEP